VGLPVVSCRENNYEQSSGRTGKRGLARRRGAYVALGPTDDVGGASTPGYNTGD